MNIFFAPFSENCCCLCGSCDGLTGEHKIKASALRTLFERKPMVIGNLEEGRPLRDARGPKSREFHFTAKICGKCNSSRTQLADRAFDQFHREVQATLDRGDNPARVFEHERYGVGSTPYLNVFRYFAKLLCCHLAESGGPRPIHISQFAIGNSDSANITLQIDRDPTYEDHEKRYGKHSYAAHGGLIFVSEKKTGLPRSFRTYLTLGPVRYLFWIRLELPVALALQFFHRSFAKKCADACREALDRPMPPELRRKLGV